MNRGLDLDSVPSMGPSITCARYLAQVYLWPCGLGVSVRKMRGLATSLLWPLSPEGAGEGERGGGGGEGGDRSCRLAFSAFFTSLNLLYFLSFFFNCAKALRIKFAWGYGGKK